MNQRLFSPKEIAQALGVSQASIKRWVDKGVIRAEKTSGGHRKISLAALQDYLKKNNKELVNPEIVDSGISAARKSGKINEGREIFYKALIDCDAAKMRAVPYDLYLSGMELGVIFNEFMIDALQSWTNEFVNGNIDEFQFRRAEQQLQGVLYFLSTLLPAPTNKAKYAMVGTLPGGSQSLAHMEEIALREQGWRTEFLGADLEEKSYLRAVKMLKPNKLYLNSNENKSLPELSSLCEGLGVEL